MTLFQFLTTWHANGLITTEMYLERLKELKATKEITTEMYLERLKELKATKEKELEEVVTAINLNSPKKETGVSSESVVDPMFKVGQQLMFKDGHTETVLEVKYSITVNSYHYRTDKSKGFESAIKRELIDTA